MQSYLAWLANMFFIFALGTFAINHLSQSTAVANTLISYDQENAMGEELYQQDFLSGKSGRIISDQVTSDDLNEILNLLVSNLDDHHYNYTVQIIDSSEVNAFTIPGGHIFFYSAMFDYLDNPEECLAVMAHEIGHNENRHMVKRLIETTGENILLNLTPTNLNEIAANLDVLGYSRQQEDQADHFAYALMVKCGVHPKYFAYVMQNLDSLAGGQEPPELLSDHPNTLQREQEALDYPVPADFKERSDPINWSEFMENLRSIATQM